MCSFTNKTSYNSFEEEIGECIKFSETDHTDIILSDKERMIFEFVNLVAFSSLVGVFGVSANIINIIIFYRQGFTNTVNIAFMGLAVSDLFCLIALEWTCICLNPFLPVYDVTWVAVEVMYLSGAWPHVCFCRITSYITVYITAERFISIAWPLKVKQIVTANRTTLIICLIYLVNFVTLVPEYATSYLGWRYVPERNATLVGTIFTSSRNDVEGLCYVLHSLLSSTSFLAVIFFTIGLVFKLRQTSEWRKRAASSQQAMAAVNKDRRTVKMIVLIASTLIVCYTPGAVVAMTAFIVGPEFNIKGRHVNLCESMWTVAYCFQAINSSVNILFYYKMSSKYRHNFDACVCACLRSRRDVSRNAVSRTRI